MSSKTTSTTVNETAANYTPEQGIVVQGNFGELPKNDKRYRYHAPARCGDSYDKVVIEDDGDIMWAR